MKPSRKHPETRARRTRIASEAAASVNVPTNDKLSAILNASPKEWQTMIEAIHAQPVSDIAADFGLSHTLAVNSVAMRMIERAVLVNAYIERRFNHCSGDCGHEQAARLANFKLVRVRRALGFALPESLSISIPLEGSAAPAAGKR